MLAKKKLLGEYKIGRTIGEGAFSKVKLAAHKDTGEKVAIKIIKKDQSSKEKSDEQASQKPPERKDSKSFLQGLSKEVKLLMRLAHPNVIKLYQVIDTEPELFIIMEYASEGELIDYIAAKGFLSERESRKFFRQLISALDHCHMAGVIHRDLKLENLLLSSDKNLLLSDFGLGRSIQSSDQILNTFCGTPLYASPELVSGIKYVGPAADIWSMGIVLFIMASGKPPFRCDSIADLYAQIKAVKYNPPDTFSVHLKALLKKILVRDPAKRATMEELRIDEWVNKDENEPPLRIPPRFAIEESNSDEVESLVSGVQQFDGFMVYNFINAGALTVRFDDIDPPSHKTSTSRPSPLQQSSPITIAVDKIDSAIDNVSFQSPQSRRGSISNIFSRLNPFASPSRKESLEEEQKPQQPRQRSKSVVPDSSAFNAAKAAAPQYTAPTSGNSSPSKSPTAAHLAPLAPAHRRRHSVAVPDKPNELIPQNSRISSTSKSPSQELVPSEPIQRHTPAHRGSLGSIAAQTSTPTRSPPSGAGTTTSATGPMGSSLSGTAPVNRVSLGHIPPAVSNRLTPGRLRTTQSNSIRQIGPSMDLISENEEDISSLNNSGSSGSRSSSGSDHGRAKTVGSTSPVAVHPRRVVPTAHQLEVKTANLKPPTNEGHERRYSIFSDIGNTNGGNSPYGDEIRSIRYSFNLQTVNKEPVEIAMHLERLLANHILFPPHLYGEGIRFERRGKYVYVCHYEAPGSGQVIFEVEICKVWLLKMHAIRIKRLGGDALSYKSTFEKIISALK